MKMYVFGDFVTLQRHLEAAEMLGLDYTVRRVTTQEWGWNERGVQTYRTTVEYGLTLITVDDDDEDTPPVEEEVEEGEEQEEEVGEDEDEEDYIEEGGEDDEPIVRSPILGNAIPKDDDQTSFDVEEVAGGRQRPNLRRMRTPRDEEDS